MTYCVRALDRLPRTARIGLLTAAIRYTAPDVQTVPLPDTHVPALGGKTAARDRTTRPCPCNSGGFCGGRGHAGC
ncbi:hypothetical protein AB5J52_39355 [Streptomyces sp. R39]|uniref:Uncharacterized protein n=1 Tax=Streptomyces sp. R39 TaxID=3238631 RepID=A0AB39QW40_9ACTN